MAKDNSAGRHAALREFKPTLQIESGIWREAWWGEMRVGYETYLAEFDDAELLKGLPNDQCPCPHWGYLFAGRMTVHYSDRDKVVEAGDVYYMAPGHTMHAAAGTVLLEFSPRDAFEKLMEFVNKKTQS